MERKVKYDIYKMLIPIIGTWWVIKRMILNSDKITWWDTSKYSLPLTGALIFYQGILWFACKIFYTMYFTEIQLWIGIY